jgi:hypothetical protein
MSAFAMHQAAHQARTKLHQVASHMQFKQLSRVSLKLAQVQARVYAHKPACLHQKRLTLPVGFVLQCCWLDDDRTNDAQISGIRAYYHPSGSAASERANSRISGQNCEGIECRWI